VTLDCKTADWAGGSCQSLTAPEAKEIRTQQADGNGANWVIAGRLRERARLAKAAVREAAIEPPGSTRMRRERAFVS
jgi:hypothetical protein